MVKYLRFYFLTEDQIAIMKRSHRKQVKFLFTLSLKKIGLSLIQNNQNEAITELFYLSLDGLQAKILKLPSSVMFQVKVKSV